MEKKELISLIALNQVKGIGKVTLLKIKKELERFEDAFDSNKIIKLDVNKKIKDDLVNFNYKKYEYIIQICDREGIKIITYFDELYPEVLREISDSPMILFAQGDLNLLNKKRKITVVGTREASEKALRWASNLSEFLGSAEYIIVSGGAIGIDTLAHTGALNSINGNTICVLGSGLLSPYPDNNLKLFENIKARGLMLSECLPFDHVNRFRLLNRNRITSALSRHSLIVASKVEGGAMHQINIGIKQGKKVICPSPDLDLRPTEGIKYLIEKYPDSVHIFNSLENFKEILSDFERKNQITLALF